MIIFIKKCSVINLSVCKWLKISLFFLFFLKISTALAGESISGVIVYPFDKINLKLVQNLDQLKKNSEEIKLSDYLPTSLGVNESSKAVIQFNLGQPNLSAVTEQELEFQTLKTTFNVVVPSLELNTTYQTVVNGVELNLKINAICSNINFTVLFDRLAARAQVEKNFAVQKLTLLPDEPTIKFNDFKCEKIAGLENEIKTLIKEQLKNIEAYKSLYKSSIQQHLNLQIQNTYNFLKQSALKKINTQLDVESFNFELIKITENHVFFGFGLNQNLNDQQSVIQNIIKSKLLTSKETLIATNLNQLTHFSLIQANSQLARQSLSSQSIKALDKLTRSRIQQFFVWPALLKRPKGLPLEFKPQIETLQLNIEKQKLLTNFTIKPTVGIWTIDRGRPMVYLKSQTYISSVLSDAQSLQLQLTGLATKPFWDKEYIKTTQCSQRISTSILDQLGQVFLNKEFSDKYLNIIEIYDQHLFSLKDLMLDENNILFLRLKEVETNLQAQL